MIGRRLGLAERPIAIRTVDVRSSPPQLVEPLSSETAGRSVLALVRDGDIPLGSALIAAPIDAVGDELLAAALAKWPAGAESRDRIDDTYDPDVHVSVVICTIAAGPSLDACVDALLSGEHQNVEVIVVNNRPDDEACRANLARFAESRPRVLVVDEARAGLAYARNAGLRIATGELIAFTDDDVVPDAAWLKAVVAAFASEEGVDGVTGLIMPTELVTPAQLLLEQFGGFAKGFERTVHCEDSAKSDPLFPYAAGRVGSGANMALSRKAVVEYGGFDDEFGTGTPALAGEDLEFFIRILHNGGKIVYEPAALIWHEHPRSMERLRKTLFAYGASLSAVMFKRLIFGSGRIRLLRSVPAGLRYAASPSSTKNAQRGVAYPARMVLAEWAGMLFGPVAYLKSRARSRRLRSRDVPPITVAAAHVPTAVGDIDIERGFTEFVLPPDAAVDFQRARLMIRLRTSPLGVIELPLHGGVADAAAIQCAVEDQLPNALELRETLAAGEVANTAAEQVSVSVVVCTSNRPVYLKRTLESVLDGTHRELELIVVDNAPRSDETETIVRSIEDSRVRYVVEPTPGLARARNCGVDHASFDTIAFTDDDVLADPRWLESLLAGFARSDAVGCVTGVVPPAELETVSQQLFDRKVGWSTRFEPRLFDLEDNRDEDPLYPYKAGIFGTGANFALSRSAVDSVGQFDEALGAGAACQSGEDFDIFIRVLAAGYAIAYEPDAITWHFHRREYAALSKQLRSYGSGLTAYAVKHSLSRRHAPAIASGMARSLSTMGRDGLTGDSGDPELKRAEVRGMLEGPFLYARDRVGVRRRRAA